MPNAAPLPSPRADAAGAGQSAPSPVALDVSTFIGGYPFRHLPHPDPEVLVRVLAREGIAHAWVGHLPSAFHRDPAAGNAELLQRLAPHHDVLIPAPIVRPDWPGWRDALQQLADAGAGAIRAYPQLWGFAPGDERLTQLATACGHAGLPLLLTVRFEDVRQRHALDVAGDLSAAHVRELVRELVRATVASHAGRYAGPPSGPHAAQIVVTAGGRDFVEEVYWGLTPVEREAVLFDFSWIWGPPSDELATLFRTIGSARFVYGTMWPLRLTQGARANLALLPADVRDAPLGEARASIGRVGSARE
ncbi:MAG: hypothetical protein IT359_11445 [Gemmatimonadaceae bacterium]|nr:hypothetical protein [Gemmatimonadaceae bacterium]